MKEKTGFTWKVLAELAGVHPKTFREWSKGNFHMSCKAAIFLSEKTAVPLPAFKEKKWNEHLRKIAPEGGRKNFEIHGSVGGSSQYRQAMWRQWWSLNGQFEHRSVLTRKPIRRPEKTVLLAEFVGIMMGDGGIAPYHISVTLNSVVDKEYINFVCSLIEKLFGVVPKKYLRKDSKALAVIVHRKELVSFCQSIGLKKGNKLKQGLDIPEWVERNRKFQIVCVRGLVDTDGCVFTHQYCSKGKKYGYKKIAFSSASPQLIDSVYKILLNLGISVKITRNWKEVRIEKQEAVRKYMKIVGTNNPKHRRKYLEK